MFRLSLLLALFAATTAFQASMPATRPAMVASTTARHVLLSDEESKAILDSAEECAEGECSVDDVAGLIHELKEQQHLMEERLSAVMNAVAHLQHINEKKERKRDEVKAMVRDLLRVFSTEKGAFPASGFSGEISKKTLTAYDVLSPKPYKKDTP